ncbi:MAG: VWA domain-containing protein [Bryobacterales bacterium]
MSRAKLVLLLMFAVGFSGGQLSPTSKAQDLEPFRIAVDVDLVVLHPVVRDRKGRFISDLGEQDFEIYEDGVRQSIRLFQYEDTPVTIGLVVDHSRSMLPKLAQVTAAARTFVQSSNPNDQMFVVNFNEKVSLGLPGAVPFTNSSTKLEYAIANAPAAGMTALYDAVVKAINQFQLQLGAPNKKALLIISDGGDNASKHGLPEVLKLAEQSSAILYTIGLFDDADPDRNPKVLRRLARQTGGEAFFPAELSDVVAVCESIAHDIRNQYTIGYVSTNVTPKGTYRKVRVVARAADHGKLHARARAGYIAGGESRPRNGQGGP